MDRLFMEKFGSRINSNGEIRLPDPSMAGVYEIQVLMPSNESILYSEYMLYRKIHLLKKSSCLYSR